MANGHPLFSELDQIEELAAVIVGVKQRCQVAMQHAHQYDPNNPDVNFSAIFRENRAAVKELTKLSEEITRLHRMVRDGIYND